MGLWDKVKETAQKAADAAKDQLEREDSLLNKAVDKTKQAADKAVVVAKDQVHREGSALNNLRSKAAATADKVGGGIDNIEAGKRDDSIEAAKRYAARKKAEVDGNIEPEPEASPRDRAPKFPNSQEWSDDEVYKKVAETMYPDFRSLPVGEKRGALCEIARYDKKLVNLMRAVGNAYIDTVRNLAEGDEGYQAALQACGLSKDRELKQAYKNWLDDSYDEDYYADDDGGHRKAVRQVGWLVFAHVGGAPGETGGATLTRAFQDAGVRDTYNLGRLLASARTLFDARTQAILNTFKPRREAFNSQFLVHRGVNADLEFNWLDENGKVDDGVSTTGGAPDDDDGGGFSGGSLMASDISDDRPPRGSPGVIPADESQPEGTSTALKRIPLTTAVTKEYDYFSEFIAEFGEHIYPQGMFVPSPRPRPKGARLKLDFHTRDGFQIVDAICEVVRCDEALPGTLSGMWVAFTYIADESKELIGRIYSQREVSVSGGKDKPAEVAGKPPRQSGGENT